MQLTFTNYAFFHKIQGHFKVKVIFENFLTSGAIKYQGLSEYIWFYMSNVNIYKGGL